MTRIDFTKLPKTIPLEARPDFFIKLEEQLLLGCAFFSEWTVFISEQAYTAFCAGADLAALLTAQAAMEVHLKWEFCPELPRAGFAELIDKSDIDDDLRSVLHELRTYRNKWTHVRKPSEDQLLLDEPDRVHAELEEMAIKAITAHMEVLFLIQGL